jgi:serine/threonine-protein kinase
MHRSDQPKPPKAINPEIPALLNQIILRSLSKDPNDRFSDGVEFHKALENIDLSPINSKSIRKEVKKIDGQSNRKSIQSKSNFVEEEKPRTLQPGTVILAIIALIFAGGLIPFWLYVILQINSLNR